MAKDSTLTRAETTETTDPSTSASPYCDTVPKWHLHRRLYDWVLHWAVTPYGSPALFILAFAESSFFPIPPDALLAPLVLGNRKKWFNFAMACALASIVGGMLGYGIGATVWQQIDETVYSLHLPGLNHENFVKIGSKYDQYSFWIVFAAGFTPIPYKVITISAGLFATTGGVPNPWAFFAMFVVASTISRSARFFMVAYLIGRYGETVKPLIDKYFNLLCVAFVVLLIGGFAVIKWSL